MSFILDAIKGRQGVDTNIAALIHDETAYTYRTLIDVYERFSDYLHTVPIQSGDRVIILMRRSFELIAAMLSVWQLDATYVPIDMNTPTARLQHIIKDVSPRCIVSEPAFLTKCSDVMVPVLTLYDVMNKEMTVSNCSQMGLKHSDSLAYLIYTSGSTGTPKGVMITQANLENYILWVSNHLTLSSADCFSFNSSMAFDFSVTCTWLPLFLGARILITPEEDTLQIGQYYAQLIQHRVTVVKWTPSYFNLLLEYAERHHPPLDHLRYIILGGEVLFTAPVARWLAIYPHHCLINEYGPTETTVGVTAEHVTMDTLDPSSLTIPIGYPARGTTLRIVDAEGRPIQSGEVGELWVEGGSVGAGYYHRPELTDASFGTVTEKQSQRFYKTGDLVQQLPDGRYCYLGRRDQQVKINGYRVECGEVEQTLLRYPSIRQAVVVAESSGPLTQILVAYLVIDSKSSVEFKAVNAFLLQSLPAYLCPTHYHLISHVPMNRHGKRDEAALADCVIQQGRSTFDPRKLINSWVARLVTGLQSVLGERHMDLDTSFFSLGMTSLLALQFIEHMNQQWSAQLALEDIFTYPTISNLAAYLDNKGHLKNTSKNRERTVPCLSPTITGDAAAIAIIAMECRLPGVPNCEALWTLCREGRESISFFKPDPEREGDSPSNLVYATGMLEEIDQFDADFFHLSPKEAQQWDPQHRLLLELAWTVLEKAGYAPGSDRMPHTGVFVSMNDSVVSNSRCETGGEVSSLNEILNAQRLTSSQFLATKLAYYLNSRGPCLTVQTACSSSLVSVVLACQQLMAGHCDLALAGGVSLTLPQHQPYVYQRDHIFSPDGHCRPFDAYAAGTVFSNGLGLVVLKRLSDAIRDRDTIAAVIKGGCVNNDGARKMGYMAPSVSGQRACIESAHRQANWDAGTIQYIEAHGTGTLIGDPLEVSALTQAFRQTTHKQQYCALGSLKANLGHTNVAAGVAGLIKTVLALQHQQIPAIPHLQQPNPALQLPYSPFYLTTRSQHWPRRRTPRRAGVSAFGVGGTNAHAVLEEAPTVSRSCATRPEVLLLLSAKTPSALMAYQAQLLQWLEQHQAAEHPLALLADAAYTLQQGRPSLAYRSAWVCRDFSDAIAQLKAAQPNQAMASPEKKLNSPNLIFLFPGQGTQYIHATSDLYQTEPAYKKHLNACLSYASRVCGESLHAILFPEKRNESHARERLNRADIAHPILFSIEYALAQLLLHWGIQPNAMLGDGVGEYVAACLAGVFSLSDALTLVCARGRAIVGCQSDAAFESFQSVLSILPKQAPKIPYLSNVTGEWVTVAEVQQDKYWIDHLVKTIQFSEGVMQLLKDKNTCFLEVGPGRTLLALLQQQQTIPIQGIDLIPHERPSSNAQLKQHSVRNALKILWCLGYPIDWSGYYSEEERCRIALPTYPFQRISCQPIESPKSSPQRKSLMQTTELCYLPSWIRDSDPMTTVVTDPIRFSSAMRWLVFDDGSALSEQSIQVLQKQGQSVFVIHAGDHFEQSSPDVVMINPREKLHYDALLERCLAEEIHSYMVLHFWSVPLSEAWEKPNSSLDDPVFFQGFYSGLFLVQAFYHARPRAMLAGVMVSTQLHAVMGHEYVHPLKQSLLSLERVLPLEYHQIRLCSVDLDLTMDLDIPLYSNQLIRQALKQCQLTESLETCSVAFRQQYCWRQTYLPATVTATKSMTIQPHGVYLITGGLGGMGLTIADWLAQQAPVTLVLLSRTALPDQATWSDWIKQHPSNHRIRQIIERLLNIINRGSRVVTRALDISDQKCMEATLSVIQADVGSVRGIFHLAGVPGSGLALLKTVETIQSVLSPKIQGLLALAHVFRTEPLDFVVSASSLTAITGGVGQLDYCAANLCLDAAMGQGLFPECQHVLTINWNAWTTVGMAAALDPSSSIHQAFYQENSISPPDAMQVIATLLHTHHRQVIISRAAPDEVIARLFKTFYMAATHKPLSSSMVQRTKHTYAIIKNIWQQVLGVECIEETDTFSGLGGDSLLAIQVLTALEQQFDAKLNLNVLLSADTLSALTQYIESRPRQSYDTIIPLTKKTGRRNVTTSEIPLYFIHPLGGTVFCYLPLVQQLNLQRPCYAIQDTELAMGSPTFHSIKEMGNYYADEIARHGTYRTVTLIGTSFGGNIAMEMVAPLHNAGIEVKKILLLDSWGNMGNALVDQEEILETHFKSLSLMRHYYGIRSLEYQAIQRRLAWLREYTPSCVSAPVILLKARRLLPLYQQITCEDQGWRPYCIASFEAYTIEGDHDKILSRNNLIKNCSILNALI